MGLCLTPIPMTSIQFEGHEATLQYVVLRVERDT